MRFEFATAARIVFGSGAAREVAPAARALGSRVLLVTGRAPGRAGAALDLEAVRFPVAGEPTVDLVRRGVALAREGGCDVVVAVGGGSAIDAGKAIAALIPNSGEPLDYLEVVGRGQPLARPAAPFIAVPTTAGTGSEVTRNAVLASPEHRVKASLRSASMLPRVAVVDPDLTLGVPPEVTAATGLDALTQVIEPYVSARANALTDLYCLEGMRRAGRSLARAYHDGADREARTDMAMASLMGGLSLANAGLGAVHGFAAPIGGEFPAPHGAVCAALLPHVMRANIAALRARAPGSEALRRYGTVACVLTGRPDAAPEEGAGWAAAVCGELRIPPLGVYGLTDADIPGVCGRAAKASSMKGNPIALTEDELAEMLARAK